MNIAIFISRDSVKVEGEIVAKVQRMEMHSLPARKIEGVCKIKREKENRKGMHE